MKTVSNQRHHALRQANTARQTAVARIVQASACGLIGSLLWALPSAQAQGLPVGPVTSEAPLPAGSPFTVASNGPLHLTIGTAGGARTATQVSAAKGPNCTGPVAMQSSIVVPLGKSQMLDLPEPVKARTVGNPAIVQAMLVSPTTLYLLGTDIGTTNMIVQGRSGSCSVIDVVVGADPGGLQHALAVMMPGETGIRVKAASDSLVLTGMVSDSVNAARAIELANAFVNRGSAPVAAGGAAATTLPPAAVLSGGGKQHERVINMMSVSAPQQVMLEVKVAEVSKTLIAQLGAQANLNGNIGSWSFGMLADYLSGGMSAFGASKANNNPLNLTIDAQKTDQLVKILAEPNLMAISGQEASFLAGGKVFIPVPQSNGAGGTTIVLQEEQFGVGLTFTPTVLENGRINLKVAPEVSELSPTGVAVSAGRNSTTILPLITTRRASTTLQVYDGQSFAIGGLMKNNITGTLKAVPGLGEIPVLGALFRSTSYEEDRTELVFVVTPRLVKPLPQHYPLPTDHFGKVSEGDVLATGNMEGRQAVRPPLPAPVPAPTSADNSTIPAIKPTTADVPAGEPVRTTEVISKALPVEPATQLAHATP